MSKTFGRIFIAASLVILITGSLFLGSGVVSGNLTVSGAFLGIALLILFLVLPIGVVGVLAVVKSNKDEKTGGVSRDLRKILDIVETRGSINISDLVIELQSSVDEVQSMVYTTVGMGLFSGYVNWEEGVLYSEEAANLKDLSLCRNCGGQLSLVGRGVTRCPYCGTEYFL